MDHLIISSCDHLRLAAEICSVKFCWGTLHEPRADVKEAKYLEASHWRPCRHCRHHETPETRTTRRGWCKRRRSPRWNAPRTRRLSRCLVLHFWPRQKKLKKPNWRKTWEKQQNELNIFSYSMILLQKRIAKHFCGLRKFDMFPMFSQTYPTWHRSECDASFKIFPLLSALILSSLGQAQVHQSISLSICINRWSHQLPSVAELRCTLFSETNGQLHLAA